MKNTVPYSLTAATDSSRLQRLRVFLVEDHPVYRHGLVELLGLEPDLEVCGQAGDATHALEALAVLDEAPDVIVCDLSLPGMNGVQLLAELKRQVPEAGLVALSMHDGSHYAMAALQAGAGAYVIKHEAFEHVKEAIRTVFQGEHYLSPRFRGLLAFQAFGGKRRADAPLLKLSTREAEVLRLLGSGFSTRQMAETLQISVKTVETHRAHIKDKLHLADSDAMVRFAVDWVGSQQGGADVLPSA
jgi:DNA-binding NarL/FixJ family response regulator